MCVVTSMSYLTNGHLEVQYGRNDVARILPVNRLQPQFRVRVYEVSQMRPVNGVLGDGCCTASCVVDGA